MDTAFLTTDDVQRFNAHFLGGQALLRDFGLLESAVMRPQSSAFGDDAYPSIFEKAAALLHGIARNHPFVDANKRSAWTSTNVFLMINGYLVEVDQGEIVSLVVDTAEGLLDVPAIAASLKAWAQPIGLADASSEPEQR